VELVRAHPRGSTGSVLVEASGGINLENVAAYARAGADVISVGALTHSVMALDIGLDLESVILGAN
jgi:nicotinate-nucleotide pyrophosphorylase (carboxylating)